MDIAIIIYESTQAEQTKTELSQAFRNLSELSSVWMDVIVEYQKRKMRAAIENYDF